MRLILVIELLIISHYLWKTDFLMNLFGKGLLLLKLKLLFHLHLDIISWSLALILREHSRSSLSDWHSLWWVKSILFHLRNAWYWDGAEFRVSHRWWVMVDDFWLRGSLAQWKLEKVDRVLGLNLLPFNYISEHVLIPLDEDPWVSLPMDQLLVSISLNSLHQGVDLQLL